MDATHLISAVYYPKKGIVDITFEDIELGLKAAFVAEVDEETGAAIASAVMPCVYHPACIKEKGDIS